MVRNEWTTSWCKGTLMVKLISNSGLSVADLAIGKCWDKPSKDGPNLERIERVANKNKHASTIEHLVYSFEIDMSRACLQEFARHRMASVSVKSSRYTLKELLQYELATTHTILDKFLVSTGVPSIDNSNVDKLRAIIGELRKGTSNDLVKYGLPEAYKTSLVWTVNARSLQNFLALRTSKAALWEIREIAYAVYQQIPETHRFLFKEFIEQERDK